MAIKVSCDSCGKSLQVRDEAAGKRVKCPDCTKPISVPLPEAPEDAAEASPQAGEDACKSCPECGEMILVTARKCRYCRAILDPKMKKGNTSPLAGAVSLKIVGVGNLTPLELHEELENGGKFVIYKYCISIMVLTFQRPSAIHFIRSDQSAVVHGLKYSLMSVITGWWGIPWGPIYTIGSLYTNFRGGQDVTSDVIASLD